ncbi:NAD+ diphosphatase [Sporomusa sp. KB1]|nr:NAD+ diphosphatase [Sporomusa sp. KB1]
MNFKSGCVPPEQSDVPVFYFLFQQNKLLVKKVDGGFAIPSSDDLDSSKTKLTNRHYIGNIGEQACYTAVYAAGQLVPDNMEFQGLMDLYGQIEDNMFRVAGCAIQVITWDETHQFCGKCGEPTVTKADERAKVCPKCGYMSFPRLSPAVILSITKGDKILLVKNLKTDFYTVVAGFVEAGETLEECLKREAREEVGIEIKNITYFGNQPWPFPHSLMLAFNAEYDKGDLTIERNELLHADWYTVDDIPQIKLKPIPFSIARRLISSFIEKNKHSS